MNAIQPDAAPTGRCPVAHGFDALSDGYFRDPAQHLASVREETPVFWYPYLNAWVVTNRDDCLTVLSDWQAFSSAANSAADVPERHREVYPPDLVSKMIVGMDPPDHTESRSVAQRGFTKDKMERLRPEIETRAHRIIDKFEQQGYANLLEEYSLELTTQTIMALLGLEYEYESMLRQLRDDLFTVLSSAHEPLPEPRRSEVWDRFVAANLTLREIIESRRDSDADDTISVMASARKEDGTPALSTERIGLHVSEFAAAGTDTTAQAMTNAVLFLTQNPESLEDAMAEPELWANVFEETVRRRPSSTFTSRKAMNRVELSGVTIEEGDMVWVALASANTDSDHVSRPFEFDIHRPDPTDHLAFTAGRHMCLGNPLARVQGATGLRVLFERLPSLRAVNDDELDFLRMVLLPVRRSLQVTWDVGDVERNQQTTVRTLDLVVDRVDEVATDALAITLRHPDGGDLPPWKAGAHIDLGVPDPAGYGLEEGTVRQYSLCSDPIDRTAYRVSIRRQHDGRGGSIALHAGLRPGNKVSVSWPRNTFRLSQADRYVFLAGGIGITPVMAMIREADRNGVPWELHYAGRTRASMPFLLDLQELQEMPGHGEWVHLYPTDETERPSLTEIATTVEAGTLVYACGPEDMMLRVEAIADQLPADSLRLERFSPKTFERIAPDEAFQVEFTASDRVVAVGADETILDAAAAAGLPVISSCREGNCGTCETPVVSGQVEHRDSILTPAEREADETMMICISRAAHGCPKLALDA